MPAELPPPHSPSRRRLSGFSFVPRRPKISSRVASRGAAPEASQALEKSYHIRASLAAIARDGGGPYPRASSAAARFGGHTLMAVLHVERGVHDMMASGDARRLEGVADKVAFDLSAFSGGSGGHDARLRGGSAWIKAVVLGFLL